STVALLLVLIFTSYSYHLHLPSFPTRRSSDLAEGFAGQIHAGEAYEPGLLPCLDSPFQDVDIGIAQALHRTRRRLHRVFGASIPDRKSTRLNSSHVKISYAVFCLKKKKNRIIH